MRIQNHSPPNSSSSGPAASQLCESISHTDSTSYKDGSFGAIHNFNDARAKEYIAVYRLLGVGNCWHGVSALFSDIRDCLLECGFGSERNIHPNLLPYGFFLNMVKAMQDRREDWDPLAVEEIVMTVSIDGTWEAKRQAVGGREYTFEE